MATPTTGSPQKHHRTSSSLGDFTLFEITDHEIKEQNPVQDNVLPVATLVVVAETEKVNDKLHDSISNANTGDYEFENDGTFKISNWAGKRFYSDYIKAGIEYKKKQNLENNNGGDASAAAMMEDPSIVMLFESPSSSTSESSFHNAKKFRFHDWPPPKSTKGKGILGPCRYASMTGGSYPVFLRDGAPPKGLMEHWESAIPGFVPPNFVPKIDTELNTVYAYLPVEQLKHHVNDPDTHYHLAGKDAIHLMTQKTTKLLNDTRTKRPCVVKTTHSMGSKGIFIIHDDEDEMEFEKFLVESGNPNYVVVDFVDIARNVACHFFMHPNGSVVWFGSNENHRGADGKFSSDSYLLLDDQEKLKEMQAPFVEEVVRYCRGMGFWGFCGIDVLFDSSGAGYLVDINPRLTGSCPALMTLQQLHRKNQDAYKVGLFRRSGNTNYYGSAEQLLQEVKEYNDANEGKSCVVIHSMYEPDAADAAQQRTRVNIGVYGSSLDECKEILNNFARK